MSNFVVITVSADGVYPLGTKTYYKHSDDYGKISNISQVTKLKCLSSHLADVSVQSIVARC